MAGTDREYRADVIALMCSCRLELGLRLLISMGDSAVHVTAQYGQTSFLNHIVAKYHADLDGPDNEVVISSQQRAQGNHWLKRICGGKIAHFGFAPIFFCTIIIQTVLFMNSVLAAPNLTKVTAAIGFWGWAATSFAVGSLIMFYRCSSQDPGYIKRAGDLGSHIDTEDPLLNIGLNNSSVWMGNWSQLCPTCKIIRPVRSKHCPTCN
ncbi:putative protein S-acyltransferase [Rosa chinensis]|uniref:Uncharacterized protein n=1 Tax=Rosa chinensis TaxID=74649 RepID=A0A2P6QGR2_ROSCH|nr:putative protein S-acyltransferase [Rosa chinensis]